MFEVNQVAIMKEGDRVQVGNKEVLVWHMEGVRKKEKISEDTLSGQKDSPEKISDENAFETKVVKVDNAYSNKPTKASDEDVDEATSDTDNVGVEMLNFLCEFCENLST